LEQNDEAQQMLWYPPNGNEFNDPPFDVWQRNYHPAVAEFEVVQRLGYPLGFIILCQNIQPNLRGSMDRASMRAWRNRDV
jgi:hypothetical protein